MLVPDGPLGFHKLLLVQWDVKHIATASRVHTGWSQNEKILSSVLVDVGVRGQSEQTVRLWKSSPLNGHFVMYLITARWIS